MGDKYNGWKVWIVDWGQKLAEKVRKYSCMIKLIKVKRKGKEWEMLGKRWNWPNVPLFLKMSLTQSLFFFGGSFSSSKSRKKAIPHHCFSLHFNIFWNVIVAQCEPHLFTCFRYKHYRNTSILTTAIVTTAQCEPGLKGIWFPIQNSILGHLDLNVFVLFLIFGKWGLATDTFYCINNKLLSGKWNELRHEYYSPALKGLKNQIFVLWLSKTLHELLDILY